MIEITTMMAELIIDKLKQHPYRDVEALILELQTKIYEERVNISNELTNSNPPSQIGFITTDDYEEDEEINNTITCRRKK